ncbi:hypothetical protein BAT_2219 [Bacillus pumilus ATCC 7061]|nr:hypothetical protein BAT_2219 [Bacillus pumilus ATCC 7061]
MDSLFFEDGHDVIFCNEAVHDIYRKRDICDRIDCTNCPSPKIDISFYEQIFKLEVKPRKSSFRKSSNQII